MARLFTCLLEGAITDTYQLRGFRHRPIVYLLWIALQPLDKRVEALHVDDGGTVRGTLQSHNVHCDVPPGEHTKGYCAQQAQVERPKGIG